MFSTNPLLIEHFRECFWISYLSMNSEGTHKGENKRGNVCYFPQTTLYSITWKSRNLPIKQTYIHVVGYKQYHKTERELPWIIQSSRSNICYLYLSLILKVGELEAFTDIKGEEKETVGMNCCPISQKLQNLQGCI